MVKQGSRKALRAYAVACLVLAGVCLGGAIFAHGAAFSSTQGVAVSNPSSNLFQFCSYDVNTGAFSCIPPTTAQFLASVYPFPVNAFRVFYLYDHTQARFTEAFVIRDVPL